MRRTDFDADLFDSIYNDESSEREPSCRIIGADISPKAIAIARANIKQAGVGRYIDLEVKAIKDWTEAPADGILVTNPPYGERIVTDDMDRLYREIGSALKHVFTKLSRMDHSPARRAFQRHRTIAVGERGGV